MSKFQNIALTLASKTIELMSLCVFAGIQRPGVFFAVGPCKCLPWPGLQEQI